MMNLKDTYAGVDPILTTLAQGYMLPETNIANFIAPVVDTPTALAALCGSVRKLLPLTTTVVHTAPTFLLFSHVSTAILMLSSKK